MNITRSRAALLGAATLLPLVAPVLGIAAFWHALTSSDTLDGGPNLAPFVLVILLTAALTVALGLFYLWHVMTTTRVDGNTRFAWALGLFLGHVTVMPVYWWVHIWRPLSSPPANAAS